MMQKGVAMKFEKNPPEWHNAGVEPTKELKQEGFKAGYKPPASYFNWFWNRVSNCLKEIQNIMIETTSTLYATQKKVEKVKRKLDSIYNISKEEVDNIMEGIVAEEDEESFFEDKEYEEEIGESITTEEIDTILKS